MLPVLSIIYHYIDEQKYIKVRYKIRVCLWIEDVVEVWYCSVFPCYLLASCGERISIWVVVHLKLGVWYVEF